MGMSDIVERLRTKHVVFDLAGKDISLEAADEIESLRQQVKELEEFKEGVDLNINTYVDLLNNRDAELAALKAGQNKPYGWYWTYPDEDGFIVNDGGSYNLQPEWVPLYTSAPTIPEGWQLVKTDDIQFCIDSIDNWGSYASEYFQDKWDLKGDIERAQSMLAAAPKPEEL
jgi:hypothetical protein